MLHEKHRWRFIGEEFDLCLGKHFLWRCKQCELEAETYRRRPPKGIMPDDKGRNCASRIVHEVMDS